MKKITIFFSLDLEIWIILTLCGDKSGEVHLSDCIKKILISSQLIKFLSLNDHDILTDAGHTTNEQAEQKAFGEYEKFRVIQDRTFLSDFDKLMEDLK